MLSYGQMEDLLKATQEELEGLLRVAEEQRLMWAAAVLSASQRLQAAKPEEFVSEYSQGEAPTTKVTKVILKSIYNYNIHEID